MRRFRAIFCTGALMLQLVLASDAQTHWPVQTHAQAGYPAPQAPSLLPHSRAPAPSPVAKPIVNAQPLLAPRGANTWAIAGGWKMAAASDVVAGGEQVSLPGYAADKWLAATVPGTVLTTYIDRGIYPDPDYGINNLAIPESLNKQNYWFRTEFTPDAAENGRRLRLTFHGINYAADVWVNGKRLGAITARLFAASSM